jgi:hypothetical protein
MNTSAVSEHDQCMSGQEKPSIDEWILTVLQEHGTQTLDHLGTLLPQITWAQLFLAIDRLSRSGKISLWSPGFGDYLISRNQRQRPTNLTACQTAEDETGQA